MAEPFLEAGKQSLLVASLDMDQTVGMKPGLRQQFPGYFWAEEKMDGYNVRVARVGDRVVAITRGGYLCPFTSDRLPDLLDLTIFEQHPDLIPCAEIV